jgi:hypothetical protein
MEADVERSREQAARRKIGGIIDYIRQGEIWFDTHDVVQLGVSGLLSRYDVAVSLDAWEEGELFVELMELAEAAQTAEMAYIVETYRP